MSHTSAIAGRPTGEATNRFCAALGIGLMAFGPWTHTGVAQPIYVPNASFESPVTPFVNIDFDSWQKSPKPDWYNESGGFRWSQLVGSFRNTAPGSADHIDNCDGQQAIWLFAVPEVALFQDYDSVDWDDPAPSREFNATFEIGKSYHLTVGVIGTSGGMQQGATLALKLYYRDAASNRVAVATTILTNTPQVFSNNTHFVDCEVNAPVVQAGAPWAGQHLGIEFVSTVSSNRQGGYWDLDNVRLIAGPVLLRPQITNGQFQFTLRGQPGARFEILASDAGAAPMLNWTHLQTITNVTGQAAVSDPTWRPGGRYYRARQLP